MSHDVLPVGRPEQPLPAVGAVEVDHPTPRVNRTQGDAVQLDAIPASPPPEVLQQVDAAAEAVERLRRQGRELRFHVDPEHGRVQIEVRDLEGHVIRRIPPSKALDIATGGSLE
ncbi:MAG: flagellar protein FlaG [Thermoleophilaceae bacterium]|nr:flagellar protein FlaG [Thermoleophilaceae bacterium]